MKQEQLFEAEMLDVHEHCVLNSEQTPAPRVIHSHQGGNMPHRHENMGPSFYGYKKPKQTKAPLGPQFAVVEIQEEDQSFDLVITDSAIVYEGSGRNAKAIPIGNRPLNVLGFPAADRMVRGSRLRCIVRDERTR